MRLTPRPRHYVSPAALTLGRPMLRYDLGREAYLLRGIGNRRGPVLRADRRRAARQHAGPERRGEAAPASDHRGRGMLVSLAALVIAAGIIVTVLVSGSSRSHAHPAVRDTAQRTAVRTAPRPTAPTRSTPVAGPTTHRSHTSSTRPAHHPRHKTVQPHRASHPATGTRHAGVTRHATPAVAAATSTTSDTPAATPATTTSAPAATSQAPPTTTTYSPPATTTEAPPATTTSAPTAPATGSGTDSGGSGSGSGTSTGGSGSGTSTGGSGSGGGSGVVSGGG